MRRRRWVLRCRARRRPVQHEPAGGEGYSQHDLSLGNRYLQAVDFRFGEVGPVLCRADRDLISQAQLKSCANVLCATADRDEDDLEEVMLYAQFRKARHRAKGRW